MTSWIKSAPEPIRAQWLDAICPDQQNMMDEQEPMLFEDAVEKTRLLTEKIQLQNAERVAQAIASDARRQTTSGSNARGKSLRQRTEEELLRRGVCLSA